MPVRIALAGAGAIGREHMARILAEPGATLAAVIDPKPASAPPGVPWFADLAEALREARPDGVVIATPNALHVPHGLLAAAAGVPMLVEKPLASDLAGAALLVEAAEAAGVPVLVGHHRRHSPAIRHARSVIEAGTLGRIVAVNGMALFRKPPAYFEGANAWRAEPGGGVILINLVHAIDDLRSLCGEIAAVQAMSSNAAQGRAVEDSAGVVLRFASGAVGTLSLSDAASAPWSWEMNSGEDKAFPHTGQACYLIAGTAGSLALPTLETWRHAGEGWRTPMVSTRMTLAEQDPLTLQMRHFCDVIGGAAPVLDGRGGLRTLEATLAVVRAAETGEVVRL